MAGTAQAPTRTITVKDAVEMTRLRAVDGKNGSEIAVFSPDGGKMAIAVRRGRVASGVNESLVLVYSTNDTRGVTTAADTVARATTTGNDDAISDLTWLGDSRHLAFRQMDSAGITQVYTAELESHRRTQLTHDSNSVLSFAVSPNNDVLYATRLPDADSGWGHRSGEAIVVAETPLNSLIDHFPEIEPSIYRQQHPSSITVRLQHPSGDIVTVYAGRTGEPPLMDMAPVGGVALLQLAATDSDYARWRGYAGTIGRLVEGKTDLWKLVILDLTSGRSRLLLDAPSSSSRRAAWSPDGRSIVVQMGLPLDVADSAERARRREHDGDVVEVDLQTRRITRVPVPDMKTAHGLVGREIREWNRRTNTLMVVDHSVFGVTSTLYVYAKHGGAWAVEQTIGLDALGGRRDDGRAFRVGRLVVAGDLIAAAVETGTRAPEVMVFNRRTQRHRIVTDLNPDFRHLQFGAVRDYKWRDTSGREWIGGLVIPPDYVPGKRYPLVIQTHGYASGDFLIDGPEELTSAFAAQPLASREMVVLQTGLPVAFDSALAKESNRAVEIDRLGFEGAIDALDRDGLIDRQRVGLIGFSATGWIVGYFATHSSYPIAALTTADNIDFSYWQYVENASWARREFELALGGPPWGSTWETFRRNSIGFNLDKVKAPWRIETYGGVWPIVGEMETFGILRAMGKPVDYVWIPNGVHQLAKPRERVASMEGNVDWYDFWLNGHEDPDPAKRDQYIRWRAMKMKGAH